MLPSGTLYPGMGTVSALVITAAQGSDWVVVTRVRDVGEDEDA